MHENVALTLVVDVYFVQFSHHFQQMTDRRRGTGPSTSTANTRASSTRQRPLSNSQDSSSTRQDRSERNDAITKKLARYIFMELLPIVTVENPFFRFVSLFILTLYESEIFLPFWYVTHITIN